MISVGDRIELTGRVEMGNPTATMKAVLKIGRQGTVVRITNDHHYVVNLDVPAELPDGLKEHDFKRWFLTPDVVKRVGVKTHGSMIAAKRDDLTNKYTNSLYYEELGVGLKELIDRLIEAEYKLERINTISKKAK